MWSACFRSPPFDKTLANPARHAIRLHYCESFTALAPNCYGLQFRLRALIVLSKNAPRTLAYGLCQPSRKEPVTLSRLYVERTGRIGSIAGPSRSAKRPQPAGLLIPIGTVTQYSTVNLAVKLVPRIQT